MIETAQSLIEIEEPLQQAAVVIEEGKAEESDTSSDSYFNEGEYLWEQWALEKGIIQRTEQKPFDEHRYMRKRLAKENEPVVQPPPRPLSESFKRFLEEERR